MGGIMVRLSSFIGAALLVGVSGCFASMGSSGSGGVVAQQTASGTGPAAIAISNSSNESIYYVYMSPVSQNTWGADQLGSEVLQPGQTLTLSNISPGTWDLRVVDRSQNYKEWRNQQIEPGGRYQLQVSPGGWSR